MLFETKILTGPGAVLVIAGVCLRERNPKASRRYTFRAIVERVGQFLSANITQRGNCLIEVLLHLVLSLVPPPQVTEQPVHEPQVPTLQSTEGKYQYFVFLLFKANYRSPIYLKANQAFCNRFHS